MYTDITLWPNKVVNPVKNIDELIHLNVSDYLNGVTCLVENLGTLFYYNKNSTDVVDNVTIIEPVSGVGRWIVCIIILPGQKLLGNPKAISGPAKAVGIGNGLAIDGSGNLVATGAGPIPIPATTLLGNPTNLPALAEGVILGNGLSFSGNTLNVDQEKNIPAKTLLGNSTNAPAIATDILVGTGLSFSGNTLNVDADGDIPASTLLGNSANVPSAPGSVTLGTGLSFSGNILNVTTPPSNLFYSTIPNPTQIQGAINTFYYFPLGITPSYDGKILFPQTAPVGSVIQYFASGSGNLAKCTFNLNPGQTIYGTFGTAPQGQSTSGGNCIVKGSGMGVTFICVETNNSWILTNISNFGPALNNIVFN
jgi:hypothetical protein